MRVVDVELNRIMIFNDFLKDCELTTNATYFVKVSTFLASGQIAPAGLLLRVVGKRAGQAERQTFVRSSNHLQSVKAVLLRGKIEPPFG